MYLLVCSSLSCVSIDNTSVPQSNNSNNLLTIFFLSGQLKIAIAVEQLIKKNNSNSILDIMKQMSGTMKLVRLYLREKCTY